MVVAENLQMSLEEQIEQHLDCLGEANLIREEDKPFLREISGKIGDQTFHILLKKLQDRVNNRYSHEKRIFKFISALVAKREDKPDKNYFIETGNLIKRLEKLGSIPYLDKILNEPIPIKSKSRLLQGLQFSFFDSHVHSYNHLKKHLISAKEPTTIVRFDSHHDCFDGFVDENSEIHEGNYIHHLLKDPQVNQKIKEIVNASGKGGILGRTFLSKKFSENPRRKNSFLVEGISYTFFNIRNLPEIKGPAILDIDLDGHEKCEEASQGGGNLWTYSSNSGMKYYNQSQILVHPKLVARTLKEKVKDPRLVLIATERAWRNRLFHWTIERDFLEELAA